VAEPSARSPWRTRRRLLAAALAGLVLLAGTAGCGSDAATSGAAASDVVVTDDDGTNGAVLTSPYTLGAATLTDTAGEPLRLPDDLDHEVTLLFFGYTSCPDICLAVMADLASTLTRLDPEEAEQVGMLMVTSDPARDDPATLRRYLDRFDPRFEGATGGLDTIVDLARSVRVPLEQGEKLPTGGYAVNHGTAVLGVLPDGIVPVLWTAGTSPAELAEDLHMILTDGLPRPSSGSGDGG
jgi:protein SCO1/2